MSECPAIAVMGYAAQIARTSDAVAAYCSGVKGRSSVPSISMPIEKSLQRVRPKKSTHRHATRARRTARTARTLLYDG